MNREYSHQSPAVNRFSVPIAIEEPSGIERNAEPVSIGVPFPRGMLMDAAMLNVVDPSGAAVSHQTRVLAKWSDGSIKWLLLDFQAYIKANASQTWLLRNFGLSKNLPETSLRVSEEGVMTAVKTGQMEVCFDCTGEALVSSIRGAEGGLLSDAGFRVKLTDRDGGACSVIKDQLWIEEAGPVRVTVAIAGGFLRGGKRLPIEFLARHSVYADSGVITLDFSLRNPMAAIHPGNLWDLGDPGSYCFRDLTFELRPQVNANCLRWRVEPGEDWNYQGSENWSLNQDSSGGQNWDSGNHVDASGSPTVTFSGYKVFQGAECSIISEGGRASPFVAVETDRGVIGAAVEKFWQNFPKALRWSDKGLEIALFPAESGALHELQGGERKRHVINLAFSAQGDSNFLPEVQRRLRVNLDPNWIEESGCVPYFSVPVAPDSEQYQAYVETIIEGPDSFFEKRESIDEYGWRNFGEVYADHEAVHKVDGKPLVSHFNNQYDFLNAACIHLLKSGDDRWRQLMLDAARHIIDIDIYHTERDIPAYNGGLFWHTDHYLEARTCTHRTYSEKNGSAPEYGGGPSNEHNYTTGLLHYYYLTGDFEAREAVLKLANWVVAMDDGSASLFSVLDSRATGRASSTVNEGYHKPGRGAGNSINALLDAFSLTSERQWLAKAEELIARCIHPKDDIGALSLDEPEYRWSYLVFLQVLGKYLEVKAELEEADYSFYYARDSLIHYGSWMLEHEVPYFDVLDKVELPTETWPAQDIRKCHVMHLAAKCVTGDKRAAFSDKAEFFFGRCLEDLLRFKTAYVTRAQVLLAGYGYIHGYFLKHRYDCPSAAVLAAGHDFDFGSPRPFKPQHPILRKLTMHKVRQLLPGWLRWDRSSILRPPGPKSDSGFRS